MGATSKIGFSAATTSSVSVSSIRIDIERVKGVVPSCTEQTSSKSVNTLQSPVIVAVVSLKPMCPVTNRSKNHLLGHKLHIIDSKNEIHLINGIGHAGGRRTPNHSNQLQLLSMMAKHFATQHQSDPVPPVGKCTAKEILCPV